MATKRMTGKDYRQELKSLEKSIKSLDVRVRRRLLTLCEKYPDAPIHADAKGKDMNTRWLDAIRTDSVIYLIENIEEWSASQQKVRQMSIDEIYNETKGRLDVTLKNLS